MNNLFYRRGLIKISSDMIDKHTDIVAHIMCELEFVPTRVEHIYQYQMFEMYGISRLFDECSSNCMCPEYKIILSQNGVDELPGVKVEKEKI